MDISTNRLITATSEVSIGKYLRGSVFPPKSTPGCIRRYTLIPRIDFCGQMQNIGPNPTGILSKLSEGREYIFQVSYLYQQDGTFFKVMPVSSVEEWKDELYDPEFFDNMPIATGLRMFVQVADTVHQAKDHGLPMFYVPGRSEIEGIIIPNPGQRASVGDMGWVVITAIRYYQRGSEHRIQLETYQIREGIQIGSELTIKVNHPRRFPTEDRYYYKGFLPGYNFFIDSQGRTLEPGSPLDVRVISIQEPKLNRNRLTLPPAYMAFAVKSPTVLAVPLKE